MTDRTTDDVLLTKGEIMSQQHFKEAVIIGGMDQSHYARLCAMAIALLDYEEQPNA